MSDNNKPLFNLKTLQTNALICRIKIEPAAEDNKIVGDWWDLLF
jgi:hypothetical protein